MTSDLWYVGKVLANEPDREDDGVGQKVVFEKNGLEKIFVSKMSGLFGFIFFHSCLPQKQ